MRCAVMMLAGLCAALPAQADSNPMQPGTWEFTRSGGMAANLIGRFCITPADIADPLSPVNGFLPREQKSRCKPWNIEWHGGRAEYSGACEIGGKPVRVSGRIVAAADTYSDTQDLAGAGVASERTILDIINGLRLGPCAH